MNQSQISEALMPLPTKAIKEYAKKLFAMCKLVKELIDLPGFMVLMNNVKGNIELVNELPVLIEPESYNEKHFYLKMLTQQENCKELFGEFAYWQPFEICHNSGSYKFALPTNNKFYNYFLSIIGINEVDATPLDELEVLNTITIDISIFKRMDKALICVSKDELRPAMTGVLIDCENYKVQLVSTDCHRLYQSAKFECSQLERAKFIIPANDAKELSKKVFKNDITEILVLSDNKISIEGKIIELIDANFPDYKVVIPEYSTFMEFDKDSFVNNVKVILPFTNKATCMVNFHLNGSIAMQGQDVDFNFERSLEMPYISKDFQDTDISFNGKFLIETMKTFKDKNVKMYTAGVATRAAIFTNDVDSVLLMPLMANSRY